MIILCLFFVRGESTEEISFQMYETRNKETAIVR